MMNIQKQLERGINFGSRFQGTQLVMVGKL